MGPSAELCQSLGRSQQCQRGCGRHLSCCQPWRTEQAKPLTASLQGPYPCNGEMWVPKATPGPAVRSEDGGARCPPPRRDRGIVRTYT